MNNQTRPKKNKKGECVYCLAKLLKEDLYWNEKLNGLVCKSCDQELLKRENKKTRA